MSVVVTGVGLVTPYGLDLVSNVRGFFARDTPATPPPEGERPALLHPFVARVPPDFDPARWVRRRKELKLMARANVLAVAAASLAVTDAGLEAGEPLEAAGLFLGVGQEPGDLDDVLPAVAASRTADGAHVDLRRLSEDGLRQMNPLSSIKTLPNMSHAHVAIALGLRGPGMTLCAGPASGLAAFDAAVRAIEDGRTDVALAGAADAPIAFSDRVSAARRAEYGPRAEAAVVLVVESAARASARGARVLLSPDALLADGEDGAPPFGDAGAASWLVSRVLTALARTPDRPTPEMAPRAPAVIRSTPRRAVALTGVGLRTPLGQHFDAFAQALLAGTSAVGPIGAFPREGFPVSLACEVPRNAAALPEALAQKMRGLDDRKGELALAAALAAVSDATGALSPDAAIVYGTGLSSVSLAELEEDCLPFLNEAGAYDYARFGAAPPPANPQAPRRHAVERPMELLAAHLGLRGRRLHHFSACAAGAAAIGHAADLVRRGEVDVALAGAADSMVHPFGLLPFILLGATSPNPDPLTAARPFDQHRDGFVMGEAGAFYVLEPLERARAAGRRVYGILLGHGTSSDAFNVTAPHPEGRGAELAMRRALADADLRPEAVDYINAHGTGTALNDVIEAAAIRRVFGTHAPPVSSSKGQFGHTIAAAGAVELAACLAALAFDRLPPNPTLAQVDARIDLDLVERGGRAGRVAVALSNSFGFGGQNATLIVGRADDAGAA